MSQAIGKRPGACRHAWSKTSLEGWMALHGGSLWLVPFAACHLLLGGSLAAAQQDAAPAPKEPPAATSGAPAGAPSGAVEEAPPLYMFDENGKPQPLLGWTLEDIERALRQAEAQTQPDRPPRYTIKSVSATGTAKKDLAELTIEADVWTSDKDVRVPLRLDQAILRPDGFEHRGSGEALLESGEDGEGYVLWIRGEPRQDHHVTLKDAVVPLSTLGEESRLQLTVPRATSWELKLTVPLAGATAEVSEGATLLPSSIGEGDKTVFTVRGGGGGEAEGADFRAFELTWQKARSEPDHLRPVLEAEGVLLATIDRRSVTTEATLTVRGHGAPFDRFRVSLPSGAQLVPGNGAGYSVTGVGRDEAAGGETLVEVVRHGGKSPEPMEEVRITTRQLRGKASEGGWFKLGGFEVIGAVRQSGYAGVASDGDWQVRCVPGGGVRQIDELPELLRNSEALKGADYLFEYFSQPFSLAARVAEVKTHVRVDPVYHVDVEDRQLRLEAVLKYTIGGAKAFVLKVELPGWQLDEVGPDAVVAVDDVEQVEREAKEAETPGADVRPVRSRVVSIPLEQPSTGEVEVTIRAHQEIEPGTRSLRVALPRPEADSLSPAVVAVWPADNVELIPDGKATVGLEPTPEAAVGPVRPPGVPPEEMRSGHQDPLLYRGEGGDAVFAAGFEVKQGEVAVDVTSEITLSEDKAEVRQTIAYAIAYEPLGELTIEVPWELAGPGALEVALDGQSLAPVPLPDQVEGPEEPGRPVRRRVVLPAAKIGKCELEIRYSIEVGELLPNRSVICEIPLVMPVEGKISSNKLYVAAPRGVEVRCRGERWRPWEVPTGRLPWHGGLALIADERVGEVVLGAHHEGLVSAVIERAWIQTCLIHETRRDRAVFCFTSDQDEVELVLPGGVNPRQVEVFLGSENVEDRQRVRVQATSDEPLRIPLSGETGPRRRWLEVQYGFSDPRPEPGRLSLEFPRLGGEVWVQRIYWELVLPQDEHVIVGPEGLVPEHQWGWTGSFWGRKPLVEGGELEAWWGASRGTEVPKATSRYLFSSMGSVARCELRTANRWLIVLGASSVVLVAGLLLIYVPACRHPGALLAVAVLLGGAAVSYPGPALLALEAGSLGLALSLLAGLLYRALGPGRRAGLWREPASSVFDRNSTQTQYRPPTPGKPPSTQTVPAAISVPTSDSNS